MCPCDCVMVCVQPDWSGNIVACHGGAAAASALDCGKTCWFRRERKKRKYGGGAGSGKIKSNFLFPQRCPRKGGHTQH